MYQGNFRRKHLNFNVSSGTNTLAQIRPMPIGMFGFNLGPSLPERVRLKFKGRLIAVRGFELSSASRAIKEEILDAVASGHDFVSNPDLPQPVRETVIPTNVVFKKQRKN